MLQKIRNFLRFQDKRTQVGFALVLLAVIGYAAYQTGVAVWSAQLKDAAGEALERHDYEEASKLLAKSLVLRPHDPSALLMAAQTARRRADFAEAVRLMRLAEKNNVPVDALDMEWQLLYIQQGDLKEVARFARFCEQNPDGPESAEPLAAIIEGSLRASNAALANWSVDLWLKYRTRKFDQAQGFVWRGRTNFMFHKQFPLPKTDFLQALELAPDHFQARLWLATWLIGDEPRAALPHVDWLRRHYPKDTLVGIQTARLARNLGQPDEAARLLDDLLATDPPHKASALMERARVSLDLNRHDEAEQFALKAQRLAPNHREPLLLMAECLRRMNRPDQAKLYLDRVQEIDSMGTKGTEETKKLNLFEKKGS